MDRFRIRPNSIFRYADFLRQISHQKIFTEIVANVIARNPALRGDEAISLTI